MGERTELVSNRVLDAVSAETGRDVLDLPPLAGAVDPDALNGLANGETRAVVSFPYAGQYVTVEATGTVTVDSRRDTFPGVGDAASDD
jgi:hypothetical protein